MDDIPLSELRRTSAEQQVSPMQEALDQLKSAILNTPEARTFYRFLLWFNKQCARLPFNR